MAYRAYVYGLVIASTASIASADPEVRDHRATGDSTITTAPAVDRPQVRYRKRPGPRFMMPLKVDFGASGANTTRGFAPGIGAAVGIHWASLSPRPTDTDVGLGVFGALLAAPEMMGEPSGVAYGGLYLEVGHTLKQGRFWRTWAAGRGEYL